MINYLRKLNRSKNYYIKRKKLSIKLGLITAFSGRRRIRKENSNINNIKHVILPFIGKGIGDAIVIGGIISLLVKSGYQVSIVADKRTYFLFENDKNIYKLFFYDSDNEDKVIQELKKYRSAIFVDSHEITHGSIHTFNIIRKFRPYITIGFIKKHHIYDYVIDSFDDCLHLSNRYIALLSFLGVFVDFYDYSISVPEINIVEATELLSKIKEKHIVVFNPYGSVYERFFSEKQIEELLNHLSSHDNILVVIVGEQHRIEKIKETEKITKNYNSSFFTTVQLIKCCDLVISPDTSIVHVSRIFNKRMVCVYPYKLLGNGSNNAVVWGPNYPRARQIELNEINISDAQIDGIINSIEDEIRIIKSY